MTAPANAFPARAETRTVWLALAVSALAASAAAAIVATVAADRGPQPRFLSDRSGAHPSQAVPRSPGVLWLAGSGSNLPLTRELAREFERAHAGVRIVVHESLGTGGGARAVAAGAIDLGLASRSLSAAERAAGLVSTPYARVAVVVATSAVRADEGVSRAELIAIFAGRKTHWRNGAPVFVVQREPGDSSHLAVVRALPGFADVDEQSRRAGRFRVAYSDREQQEALLMTEGSVGLFDRGAITAQRLPLRMLSIDGVAPTADNLESGTYPFVKELSFVSHGTPSGLARSLVSFATSESGRAAIRANGYEPPATPARVSP